MPHGKGGGGVKQRICESVQAPQIWSRDANPARNDAVEDIRQKR